MRDLLEPLAPEVNVEEDWRSVAGRLPGERRRARAVRVAGGLAAVLLVAGGAAVALRSGDEEGQRVTTGPPTPGTEATPVTTVDLPDGWQQAQEVLTPDLTDPREVLAVGTYALRPNGPEHCSHVPGAALDDLGPDDAFVWVARPSQQGEAPPIEDYVLPVGPEGDPEIPACTTRTDTFTFSWGSYTTDGQAVYLLVALGSEVTADTREQTLEVLNGMELGAPLQAFHDEEAGVSGEYPEGWEVAGEQLTAPIRSPFSRWLLALGTGPLLSDHLDCDGSGCTHPCPQYPTRAIEAMAPGDALIWVEEQLVHRDDLRPRPEEFVTLPLADGAAVTPGCRGLLPLVPGTITFDTVGRRISLHVAVGSEASDRTKAEALEILNSLEFDRP
jgi:hypothetical protein